MRVLFCTVLLCMLAMMQQSCKEAAAAQDTHHDIDAAYVMIWNDEFDNDGLPDPDKWTYDIGDGCPHVCGWGNNELQYYTDQNPDNARVEAGHLIIEAHKTVMGDKGYTSARMLTRDHASWKGGRIEVKAKLPTGKGTWPAIWMLPEDNTYGGWPKSGEIDIMEHVGYEEDSIYGTVHTEAYNHMIGTQVGRASYQPQAESDFAIYSIIWDQDKIEWYIDNQKYHEFVNKRVSYKEWPFDHPFHLILNLAVGGNWGGKMGVAEDIWPQRMEVDYVRVYQKKKNSNLNLDNKKD